MVNRPPARKPGIASLAVAVLALFILAMAVASSAQAAGYNWEFEGRTLPERGLPTQTTSSAVEGFTLTSTALNEPFKVSCSGTTASGKIANGGTGEFVFSGCTLVEPAKCTAKPFTIVAATEIVSVGGKIYEKFTPASESRFAKITLQNCAVAGSYLLGGSFAGEPGNEIFPYFVEPLSFSPEIDAAAGTGMTLGKKTVALTGSLKESVTGSAASLYWYRSPYRADIHGWQIGATMLTKGAESVAITGGPNGFSGTLLGSPAEFSCSSIGATGARLIGGSGFGQAEERFVFSGCGISKPSGCTIPATIETELVHSSSNPNNNYIYENSMPKMLKRNCSA
jgi:hypothetical protein